MAQLERLLAVAHREVDGRSRLAALQLGAERAQLQRRDIVDRGDDHAGPQPCAPRRRRLLDAVERDAGRLDADLAPECPQGDHAGNRARVLEREVVDAVEIALAAAGRHDGRGRHDVGTVLEARDPRLGQARAVHEHVQVVDAGAVLGDRRLLAPDADHGIRRVRVVGEKDVVVRRRGQQPASDHDHDQDAQDREPGDARVRALGDHGRTVLASRVDSVSG